MTDETVCCWPCERFHEPEDVCEYDRNSLYADLLVTVGQLARPLVDLSGHPERVLDLGIGSPTN